MKLIDFLNNGDKMSSENGIVITHIEEGLATAKMTVEARHLNAGGVCQGGAIFTLADFAQAAVCNASGNLTVAISCNITFHNGAKPGDTLTATARLSDAHPKIPFCTVTVKNQNDVLIATLTGSSYSKKLQIPNIDGLE